MPEDEASELHRFLQDMLIKIEFAEFEPGDEEDEPCCLSRCSVCDPV
jgi:hypothetical protein